MTRYFVRWMRKTELTEQLLCKAVDEMHQGLIDAELGSGLVKKRVAVGSRGKSRGIRTLVATNKENLWVFVFGFSKNDRANISDVELEALQFLTEDLLNLTNLEMKDAVQDGSLQEICHDQPNQSEESHTRRRA